ncbi:trehalose-phosphate synthase subunit [Niveomyces insectorum RCEF 264]|uniref:Trehalose-phosphate synthase subunit n=1 Tax=Niveomyces insectorum RCEF 264 TaxID=1081102 RepID=A0A167SRJ9_9HYPO|nr:trehalose-phosphate synthase subunit [Niveomyces insectorum RCEF 264]
MAQEQRNSPDASSHAPQVGPASLPSPSEDHEGLSPSISIIDEQTDTPDLPPHLRKSITQVPVTPELRGTPVAFKNGHSHGQGSVQHCGGYFVSREEASSSLVGRSAQGTPLPPAVTPPGALKNNHPGANLLKQTLRNKAAMSDSARRGSLSDIRQDHPDLALSGNIISATFNIPYSVDYRKGSDWVLKPRRGQSALFDSFSYLSSDGSPWNHTVVAWTGEIGEPVDMLSPPDTPLTSAKVVPLNAFSAPISVDGFRPTMPQTSDADGLFVSREEMARLEQQLAHDQRLKVVPVWLADDAGDSTEEGIRLKDQARWRRYAEHELYGLFHYKQHGPTDGREERLQWADFYRMNQKFANKIAELYKPGDIVVIHDYYLMLLPSMLRQRLSGINIAFFLHSPFPSSEFFRCLPRRREVLEGVLGANLIGFQSFGYARHFSSCCTRLLGFKSDANGVETYGSRVEFGVFPIGIDVSKVERLAWSAAVNEKYDALRTLYAGKKIIVGRDRLDSIRGVDKKLMAFESFLGKYPEWRNRVVLIQVTSPTSIEEEHDNEEAKIASRVNELVMSINGTYGSLGFSPVQHYPQYLSQDEYFALLRAGDIGLITSVRDGMNTTSLEYVICQRDNHGPLIISEFSGTAGSLREAIHINPWDYTVVADAIHQGLSLPADELARMQQSLYEHVSANTVQRWIDNLLNRLVHVLSARRNVAATPLLDRSDLLARYRDARRRLFLFDYDGTLTPIVREPSAAVPSSDIIHALRALASDHRNAVWIISGRDQEFLSHHLGHIPELGFSAEHGSFMRHPGQDEWENLAEKTDMGWQSEVLAVFQKYTDRVPGSFIERKRCALTWHYRLADPEQGAHMARECQKELQGGVARTWDVDVMTGKANLEVRPTFINKGEIVKRLVASYNSDIRSVASVSSAAAGDPGEPADDKNSKNAHLHGSAPPNSPRHYDSELEFVLCLGDDATDEDMFRALNGLSSPHDDSSPADVQPDHLFTVTVGASTKVTLAKWHLLEPADVIDCVSLLAGTAGPVSTIGEVNLAALTAIEGRIPT